MWVFFTDWILSRFT